MAGVFLLENVPDDFLQAVEECDVRAGPDLRVASMVPQPYENALQDLALPAPLSNRVPLLARAFAFVISLFSIIRLK